MIRSDFMLGVAVHITSIRPHETRWMRDAGLQWLRCSAFGFDQERLLRGEPQDATFVEIKNRIAGLKKEGFQILGISPGPREMAAAAGTPGSREYLENYQRACRFLANEYQGLIDWWQVANELDIWIFRHNLSLDQSAEFLKHGIRGIQEADASLKTGINITLFPSLPGEVDGNTELHEGVYIARRIYEDRRLHLDYAGFDSYPGSWRAGGVESWHEYLDQFYQLTGKPIIVQEFGYASAGEMMSDAEIAKKNYPCEVKKWRFSWKGAHTPQLQAEFVEESLKIFAAKPYVIGATYYSWKDANRCWQCKREDCPVETAWGLVDREGRPKPSYFSMKFIAGKLFPHASPAPHSLKAPSIAVQAA